MLSARFSPLPAPGSRFCRPRRSAQPAVKLGSLTYPPLSGVPVFMPVPFEVTPGYACLVIFADVDIDAWLSSGEAEEPLSARRHSLSDGFAFVGFKTDG